MGDIGDIVKNVVARVCAGRLPASPRSSYGSYPQQPGPSAVPEPKPCKHPLFELFIRPCLECNRFCNCGHTYFPKSTYPDVFVRSADKHIVQLSGDMVRASETLSRMVNEFTRGKNTEPLEEDNVVVKRETGNAICITEYRKVEKNEVALENEKNKEAEIKVKEWKEQVKEPEEEVKEAEKEVKEAEEEVNEADEYVDVLIYKGKPILYTDYPIRKTARNLGKYKEEKRKQKIAENEQKQKIAENERKQKIAENERKNAAAGPSISVASSKESTADVVIKGKLVDRVPFKVVLPPLRKGRQFAHYKEETLPYREDGVTCNLRDIIEFGDKKAKVLALFDQDSNVPTLGICKDTLLKVQYFMDMHLDDVEQRVSARKRLLHFREVSPYHDPGFAFWEDKHSFNTFAYADWEEDFFNRDLNPGDFFDMHKANQELLIWDLYFTLEKWVYLNRGFPQNMVNGYWDINEDPEYDEKDKKNVYGLFAIWYANPYKTSRVLRRTQRVNISQVTRLEFKPRWFCIRRSL